MQQLTQLLKDGTMELSEVPFPALQQGTVLVRNHYSVISAGTEGKTVKDARLGYIGKAKARKEEVKKVIQTAKSLGLVKTYQLVMNKLESPSPLGYSSAGEVIAVAPDVTEFNVGDFVACGGATANHAEVVSVPKNLCVKLPNADKIKEASFTTIAAIAMQGIRQAEAGLGETVVVIGLGLVGQITMQLLKAAGVTPIGIDIDQNAVDLAKKCGVEYAFNRNTPDLDKIIFDKTRQYGADSIIITAATSSNDPIEFAGTIARQKAKVVIVGAVPTGFSRKNYYRKELDLRMSCSYGPGRYDDNYEVKGIDYPIGYVRWTENRNMQAFVDLLYSGKLNLQPLITHQFKFEQAKDAYQIIVNKTEPFCGIVLKYDTQKKLNTSVSIKPVEQKSKVKVGFIGAGNFAQNFLLPNLKNLPVSLISVATARPHNAKNIAQKFGFSQAFSSAEDIINNPDINTVFIVTRHHLHAQYIIKALQQNKIVFTEKPLALTPEELNQIVEAEKNSKGSVMVGFNRRFAPLTQKAMDFIGKDLPVAINYRINAGQVPADHWVHDPQIGGGRIIGEACHFIDYCRYFANSEITHISGSFLSKGTVKDTAAISIGFANGSVANISYFSNGSKLLPKEQIEIFSGSRTAVFNDFKSLNLYDKTLKTIKSPAQDKGHKSELNAFVNAILKGEELPVPFNESVEVTMKTFELLSVNE